MPTASAESFIGTVAPTLRGTVTRENPIFECELPLGAPFDGSCFEALIAPVVPAPVFTIRREASAVFTLQGGEINEFIRRIIMLALVCAFIVGVTNLASALGITGAVA